MTLEEKQKKYPNTNLSVNPLLCLYIYGGSRYRMLSINEKINLRFFLMQNTYSVFMSDLSFKDRHKRSAFKRVSTPNYYKCSIQ